MDTGFLEYIIYKYCANKKKIRENLLNILMDEEKTKFMEIIKKYDLKRINDKYILKINSYTQNSYNRNKIKEEELIILSILLYINTVNQKSIELNNVIKALTKNEIIDEELLLSEVSVNNKENDQEKYFSLRIKLYEECMKNKLFREMYIKEIIDNYQEYTQTLLKQDEFSLIAKKYIKNEEIIKNGYYYKKLKEVEISFIKKSSYVREWLLFINRYNNYADKTICDADKQKLIDYVTINLM